MNAHVKDMPYRFVEELYGSHHGSHFLHKVASLALVLRAETLTHTPTAKPAACYRLRENIKLIILTWHASACALYHTIVCTCQTTA